MKLVLISDTHGDFPKIPECDLFIHAGDVCPATDHSIIFQVYWLNTSFRYWLESIPAKKKIIIGGNHDFALESHQHLLEIAKWDCTYLQDSETEYEGLNIFGTPFQIPFFEWAFNLPEPELAKKWALIPEHTDILVVHGPPYGYGDLAPRGKNDFDHVGSKTLLERIKELKRLKLIVTGHIHAGRGIYEMDDKTIINASLLNEQYQLVNNPVEWEI